jgi:hypothetical protein
MAHPTTGIQRTAALELNALRLTGVLGDEFEKARVPASGTPVFDITGVLLYYRLSLTQGGRSWPLPMLR